MNNAALILTLVSTTLSSPLSSPLLSSPLLSSPPPPPVSLQLNRIPPPHTPPQYLPLVFGMIKNNTCIEAVTDMCALVGAEPSDHACVQGGSYCPLIASISGKVIKCACLYIHAVTSISGKVVKSVLHTCTLCSIRAIGHNRDQAQAGNNFFASFPNFIYFVFAPNPCF